MQNFNIRLPLWQYSSSNDLIPLNTPFPLDMTKGIKCTEGPESNHYPEHGNDIGLSRLSYHKLKTLLSHSISQKHNLSIVQTRKTLFHIPVKLLMFPNTKYIMLNYGEMVYIYARHAKPFHFM